MELPFFFLFFISVHFNTRSSVSHERSGIKYFGPTGLSEFLIRGKALYSASVFGRRNSKLLRVWRVLIFVLSYTRYYTFALLRIRMGAPQYMHANVAYTP